MVEQEKKTKPPYVPYQTFKSFVDGFEQGGVPAIIDRTLMSNYSGTIQSTLTNALHSMGFTKKNGTPTERFLQYVGEDEAERLNILRESAEQAFSVLFDEPNDLSRMTPGQFNDLLRNEYGLSSSTLDKAANFFLALAKDTNLAIGTHLEKRKPAAKRTVRKIRYKSSGAERSENGSDDEKSGPGGDAAEVPRGEQKPLNYQLIDLLSNPDVGDEEQRAVWTLVQFLARQN